MAGREGKGNPSPPRTYPPPSWCSRPKYPTRALCCTPPPAWTRTLSVSLSLRYPLVVGYRFEGVSGTESGEIAPSHLQHLLPLLPYTHVQVAFPVEQGAHFPRLVVVVNYRTRHLLPAHGAFPVLLSEHSPVLFECNFVLPLETRTKPNCFPLTGCCTLPESTVTANATTPCVGSFLVITRATDTESEVTTVWVALGSSFS